MTFDNNHTLASQLSDDNVASQDDCPLFRDIPSEIRHLIFSLALTAYNRLSYGKGTFYDRPGYHYSHSIDTELLRTCTMVYLECSLLPVKLNEVVAWCGQGRGPPHCELCKRNPWPVTLEQMDVTRFHFFTQQMWLEKHWIPISSRSDFNPSIIHFTIRHTDWWDWEHERALHLDPKQKGQARKPFREENEQFSDGSWGAAFRHLHGLQQFVLELETVEAKGAELDETIARAAGWRFPLGDGNVLVLDESRTVYSTRIGLNRFHGKPSERCEFIVWDLYPETYQTPKLKPQIVEMAEDFLNTQEAFLFEQSDSLDTQEAGSLTSTSPQTINLERLDQALDSPNLASNSFGSKAMTSKIAHKIIAEVQNIQGFQPDELARIYSYMEPDLTEAQIKEQTYREMEDMLALHYRVVSLTWVAKPGAVEGASAT
ncbi:hypothetical protein MMC17_007718 [Xylographa soralifera]|nr:hypothetical protein [Xylographa soralifera]